MHGMTRHGKHPLNTWSKNSW